MGSESLAGTFDLTPADKHCSLIPGQWPLSCEILKDSEAKQEA